MTSATDELADAVLDASRVLVAVAARSLAAAPSDVTLPQYRVLVVLATRGPQRPSDLAAELGVAASSITRMCDRLVVRGWSDADCDRRTDASTWSTSLMLVRRSSMR